LARSEVREEDCTEVFDTYAIRPHEQLREPTYGKDGIRFKLNKLAEARDNATQRAILLRRDGSVAWRGTLAELVAQEADPKLSLDFVTVVLPPSVGGLSDAGLFVPTEPTADDVADLKGTPRLRFLAHLEDSGWRASSIVTSGKESAEFEADSRRGLVDVIAKATRLKLVTSIQIGGRDENEQDSACYLLYFADPLTAAQSSAVSFVSREKQTLPEHSDRVGALLADFATRVGLAYKAPALGLAGGGHDTGKRRHCWQRAIGNTDLSHPLAKSGHARFNTAFNGGYRHEFGSLLDAMNDVNIQSIANEVLRDVVLHSIASHHGYARPHFREVAFDKETAYKKCREVAVDAMQRFGRLQAHYGWWGLAWLEALLKAADALVSSGLDQGEPHE
jgi:CRISPR-associated endonuclease/helicase Cas3